MYIGFAVAVALATYFFIAGILFERIIWDIIEHRKMLTTYTKWTPYLTYTKYLLLSPFWLFFVVFYFMLATSFSCMCWLTGEKGSW